MATYTEFSFKATLRKDTPLKIISLLKRVIIDNDFGVDKYPFTHLDVFKPDIHHPFFYCRRWYQLLRYTQGGTTSGSKFYQKNNEWVLDLHTCFRNYDDEIEKFVEWISLYIVEEKNEKPSGWYLEEGMEKKECIVI